MSADPIDAACEEEQRSRDLAIRVARIPPEPEPYHTHCKWCGEPSERGSRYCSYGMDSCATDANRYQATLKRSGVVQ